MSYGAHTADHVGPSYFAVFLVCIGLFPVNPAISTVSLSPSFLPLSPLAPLVTIRPYGVLMSFEVDGEQSYSSKPAGCWDRIL